MLGQKQLTVGDGILAPRDVFILIPGTCGCVLSHGEGELRLVNQLTLRQGYCALSRGAQYSHKGP